MKTLVLLLLLSGCAEMGFKGTVCVGYCATVEAEKGESPVTKEKK